ncbi:MAG: hypothetical protein ABW044_11970 [Cellvibrio sp.]
MLKLFLPVIFPSWRFFSSIGPSPRIHIAFTLNGDDEPVDWREFRSRPQNISIREGVFRLFHNPHWNETLYINTCAERLFEGHSEMREREIMRRILVAIQSGEIAPEAGSNYVRYRISAIIREGEVVTQPVTFISVAVGFRKLNDVT